MVQFDKNAAPVGFFVEKTEEYTPAIPDVVTQKVNTYVKNLQGDVIRILDENGNTVVSYTYDPWGVPTVTGDTDLAALNPCSYRGYEYDEESGLYYLQSRYYDPQIGRFLNADTFEFLSTAESHAEFNLFSYCGNNPIMFSDPYGYAKWLVDIKITDTLIAIVDFALVVLSTFLICLAAVKLKVAAYKIYKWISKSALKSKLNGLLTKCATLIVGAIHSVVYKIADTVPAWALQLSVAKITDALLDLIDLSAAEMILNLLDRFDGDGKTGYIRYVKL